MAERDRQKSRQGDPDEGFFRRWSRRKAESQSAATTAAVDPSGPPECATASLPQPSEPAAATPVDPKDLPDIESLDANSDFTVFMRPGVPELLRTQALRKLWRSDPIFSNLDGLVEYGEDYSIASWPKHAIKTAYKVGRGFLEELGEGVGGRDQAPPSEPTGKPADQPTAIAEAPAEPPPSEPAGKAADDPTLIAVAPPEPRPGEPAALRDPGGQQHGPRPAAGRRRAFPTKSGSG
jgi:Protein of unknown function (DUF3306)